MFNCHWCTVQTWKLYTDISRYRSKKSTDSRWRQLVTMPSFEPCAWENRSRTFYLKVQQPQVDQGFTITLRHSTLGRTPLNEWSSRSRELYLTTHNAHNRHTYIKAPGEIRTRNPCNKPPQSHAIERATTEMRCTVTDTSISSVIWYGMNKEAVWPSL